MAEGELTSAGVGYTNAALDYLFTINSHFQEEFDEASFDVGIAWGGFVF